jgi:phosphatidylethanolamine/phosphatidyl-N-methylethanolamine N-methyltransferase
MGWRTDLSLNTVLEGTDLHVARKQNVNPLRFWALVECVNRKNGNGAAHKNGISHSNGTTVYTHSTGAHATGHTSEEALA